MGITKILDIKPREKLHSSQPKQGISSFVSSLLHFIPARYAFLLVILTSLTGCIFFRIGSEDRSDAGGDADRVVDADGDERYDECEIGEPNESYSGPDGTAYVGVCQPLIEECVETANGNRYEVEQEEILPSGEICDGLDNDCQGITPLGVIGAIIHITHGTCETPLLVWTGNEYGVIWRDWRDGSYEIYFKRISKDGTVINPGSIRLTDGTADVTSVPSLVWTGTEYGMVWSDLRDGNNEIYFKHVSENGESMSLDIRITFGSDSSRSPTLVWNGTEYGIIWREENDTGNRYMFWRISSDGIPIGSDVQIANDAEESFDDPVLVWTGNEYGMTWTGDYGVDGHVVYFGRLSREGIQIGPTVQITDDTERSFQPVLVWTGSEYGIGWVARGALQFRRVSAEGILLGSEERI